MSKRVYLKYVLSIKSNIQLYNFKRTRIAIIKNMHMSRCPLRAGGCQRVLGNLGIGVSGEVREAQNPIDKWVG